ncbi:MAG: peptidylprolyl isomerase [Deltaproteobacteria bacterium]
MRATGRLIGARGAWVIAAAGLVACSRGAPARAVLEPPTPVAVFGRSIPARLRAALLTDEGTIHCVLEPSRTPLAAALFVGLARGGYPWRDPRDGVVRRSPLYDALTFHRAMPGVLIQTGCPLGDGNGHPGYRVPLEPRGDDGHRLAAAGALFFATYTPPPYRRDPSPPPPGRVVGSQIGIALTSMGHLAGRTTVLGACGDLDVVARIAARATPPRVVLRSIRVAE